MKYAFEMILVIGLIFVTSIAGAGELIYPDSLKHCLATQQGQIGQAECYGNEIALLEDRVVDLNHDVLAKIDGPFRLVYIRTMLSWSQYRELNCRLLMTPTLGLGQVASAEIKPDNLIDGQVCYYNLTRQKIDELSTMLLRLKN